MRITVRAKPGSRKDLVYRDDNAEDRLTLVVHVRARPIEGAANRAVEIAIADALGVRPRDVTVAVGGASRTKVVDVAGSTAQLREAIRKLPGEAHGPAVRR